MEILNAFREDPVMAWLVLLGLVLLIVSVASVLWHSMSGHSQADAAKQPAQTTRPTRFGNQSELIVLLIGIVLLLAFFGWIRSIVFG